MTGNAQKVIFIIGLPGSGKSTYLEMHRNEFGDALLCDDYYRSRTIRPRVSLTFEGSAYFEDVSAALKSGSSVVVADILFCDETRRNEAQDGLTRLLSKLNIEARVEYRFFENDRAACIENIMRRNRPERVKKELAYIEEIADQYHIPIGVEILPVYRP